MDLITSNQNSLIKEVKALKLKKNREEKRLFFIEGERLVEAAIDNKEKFTYVLISSAFRKSKNSQRFLYKLESSNCRIYEAEDKLFNEISDTENPQGVLAVLNMKENRLSQIINDNSFIVILDAIQDPGNMGTMIRTADASGSSGIIYSKGCVDLYNPKVLRGTMGSVFHLPIVYCEDLAETIKQIKNKKIKIYAAHLKAEKNYFSANLKEPSAIIIGNEANGISDEIAALADELLRIPMPGKAESLNASIAAGLMMYEAVRQRQS